MMTLEEFETYNLANELSDFIWNIVNKWDSFDKDTIGKQLVRSSDSISANLAEGYGRFFYKENKQFCYYSRGSLLETKTWIEKAARRNLIAPKESEALISKLEIVHKKLKAYIKSIGKAKAS
ncbi:MAG: four helix bundle protein [Bacteroidia bacterium]|jgi:four helix bundle protein|nr:four helix bundle protein [Bacteroidia bacterium]